LTKWPKQLPALTPEQERVREDFMTYWHEVLPQRYGAVERFNHGWPAKTARPNERTLEIGSGLGEHINAEPRFARQDYVASELRPDMAAILAERHPEVQTVVADVQQPLPFDDASFDRVLAIHVLEHLPDLPAALTQIRRVLKPGGRFIAVIPCEGGLAYSLARRISAQRIFEQRYGMSYDWFVKSEHINLPREIIEETRAHFDVVRRRHFPLLVPVTTLNLVIGLELAPR
jgi:SAM-dependent methyltransferase